MDVGLNIAFSVDVQTETMDKILIVEDVDSLREVISSVLQSEGFAVDAVADAETALENLKRGSYSCVLSDFKLPGMNGIELLRKARQFANTVPFLIMTAYGSVNIAVEAMKEGANDFIVKPFDPSMLCMVMRDLIKHRRILDRTNGSKTRRERSFVSVDPKVEQLLKDARKVARVDSSVLILGESGTGKELIARYIHEQSPRRDKPFLAVNCGAMPPELLESEFFGHEAGAFTGATQSRIGVFEFASEGTVFLDEVGDMPLPLQVKLLRALQEREIRRVGSNKSIKVDPRIISATNKNIEEQLSLGEIRDDFYYRVAVVTLEIPPLRERPGDLELLTDYFVSYFSEQIGKTKPKISEAAKFVLKNYPWPGNARELENVVERAVIMAEHEISPDGLGLDSTFMDPRAASAVNLIQAGLQAARLAEIELIRKILTQTSGNKSKAAQLLGVSYKTLLNKVKEYEIQIPS